VVSAPAWALRKAHEAAVKRARADQRVPVLQDVIDALYAPTIDAVPGPFDETGVKVVEQLGVASLADVVRWGLPVAMGLERYTTGDMAGLINGETRASDGGPLDLRGQLIVFDTSALTEGSDALGLVVGMMAGFIQAVWSAAPGDKYLLNEEAYFASRLRGVGQYMLEWAKRGRGKGISTVTFFHRLTDFPEDSDLWALVKESDVAHLFRQEDAEEATRTCRMFGLEPATYQELLTTLPQGTHVLKITNQPPEQIQHLRTDAECWLTDTDAGMAGLTPLTPQTPGGMSDQYE
jgi:hypothetical protein